MTTSHLVVHTAARWLDFLGIALLVGAVAFRYLAWRGREGGGGGLGVTAAPRLLMGAVVLVSLTSMVDLGLRARMMSPTMDFGTLLPLVLRGTHLGHVWLFKVGCLMALWGVTTGLWTGRRAGAIRAVSAVAAAAGLGLAQALSGHAADQGNVTVAVLTDWIHVMATAAWFGGLIWLRLLLPALPVGDHSPHSLVVETLRRFSRMAAASVGLLVLTGAINAVFQVAAPALLLTTAYGRTLVVKVALVAGMAVLGGLTRFYVIPGLTGPARPFSSAVTRGVTAVIGQGNGPAALIRRGLLFIGIECALGVVVLWCAAALTQFPPPRAAMTLGPPHVH